jgi:hypothetical protein
MVIVVVASTRPYTSASGSGNSDYRKLFLPLAKTHLSSSA